MVKSLDPNAEIYGPAFWGILPCYQAGNGDNYSDPDWEAVKSQYSWYMDYYLKQMADAEKENGMAPFGCCRCTLLCAGLQHG